MAQAQNPLRTLAGSKFGVSTGTNSLVAGGIYGVEDILQPILTDSAIAGDPRMFISSGRRRVHVKLRKVNKQGWIGPKARQNEDKDTILQIKFQRPKKFNFLSFELLRVPQVFSVHYYDPVRKRMVKLTDGRGQEVGSTLRGFKANVASPHASTTHKWRGFGYDLPKIRTTLVEIRLNRDSGDVQDSFSPPEDTPYSLGVRNLRIKFKKRDDGDDDDDDDGIPTPVSTNERPKVVRYTSLKAHDGGDTSYWECAPQGAASSIVPFYLDVRAANGTASVFDTLKMTPLWPGPSMVAYWSNDDTTSPWSVSGNRTLLQPDGSATPSFVEDYGLLVTEAASSWTVSNDFMRSDMSRDFVVGLQYTPTSVSGADRWLWVFESPSATQTLGLRFNVSASGGGSMTGNFEAVEDGSTTLYTSAEFILDQDTAYGVVFGYNRSDLDSRFPTGWYLSVSPMPGTNATITTESGVGTAPATFFPATFRVGNGTAMTTPCLGYLSRLWVRMDSFVDAAANNYLKSPDPFIMGDGNPDQRVHGFHSAVLVARLQKTLSARVGPGASYFRSKEWTPVPTDYSLTSTQYTLPLVSAKFLKLEFTNLVPRVYLTEEEELVVTDYPAWVRDWYRAGIHQSKGGLGYNATTSRNYFEGQTGVRTPGDRKKNPQLRGVLEGRGSGLPPIIYHGDRATVDLAVNPSGFDGSNLYHEQEFATQPMRFYRQSRHDYEVRFVQAERHAFFVGLKELQVFRSDYSVLLDTPEYAETYDDDQYIESTDFINTGGSMTADLAGDQMVSVSFPSFSKFSTIQMAVLDSGWESMMSQAQIDLGTVTHLTDIDDNPLGVATQVVDGYVEDIFPSVPAAADGQPGITEFDDETFTSATMVSTSTYYEVVTGQYLGARGGNVIQISRADESTSTAYGVKTRSGIFDGTGPITGDNPRTSAVTRVQLPKTNSGRYELRLYANNTSTPGRRLVASKPINIPIRTWKEVEVAYVAVTDDIDWEAEVVQLDSSVTEPIVVDMLGIWQNSIRWDVANEDSEVQSIALTRQAELYGVSFPGLTYEPPNEVQTVTLVDGPTGGIWTLTYGAETTVDLAFDAAAATVEAALQSLTGLSGVTVTRSGSGTQVDPYVYEVTFLGSLAGKNANQLVSNGVRLTSVGLDVMDDPSNPSFADGTTNTYQDQLLPGALGSGGSDIMPTTEDGGYQEESLPAAPDNSFGDGWDFGSDEEYTVTNLVPLKYPDGFDDEVVTSLSAVDLPPHETEMTYGSLLPAPNVVVVTTQEGGIDALGWPGIDDDQYMVRQGKSNATFRLTFDGNETIDLSIGASATTVRKALEALPSFAPGDIEVNGPDRTDGHYEVTFAGNYAQVDVDPLSVTSAVGCSGVVTVKLPAGGNWQPVLWPMNKPNGYFRFPTARNVVKVRATAMRAGAVVSGWTIVPWYIESSMVMRSPIDYNPPWGVSDDQDLRDTTHKPMFMIWNHYFPQRYSVNLIGLPVPSTL